MSHASSQQWGAPLHMDSRVTLLSRAALRISLLVLLTPSDAVAVVSFTPRTCAPCGGPNWTDVRFRYDMQMSSPTREVFKHPYEGEVYPTQLVLNRTVVANQNVKTIAYHFSAFDMEAGWDFLDVRNHAWGDYSLTGNGYGSDFWMPHASGANFQTTPGLLTVTTDYMINKAGFKIDRAKACCESPTSIGYVSIEHGMRYKGLLLPPGQDVVYFVLPQVTGDHQTVALWGDNTAGNDFDLYARCGTPPTATDYYALSWGGNDEFLHLDPAACPNSQWFIAVHAWSGHGWFDLIAHRHRPEHHYTITAGTNSSSWDAQTKELMRNELRRGAALLYAATQGTHYIEAINFYHASPSCETGCAGGRCRTCFMGGIGANYSGKYEPWIDMTTVMVVSVMMTTRIGAIAAHEWTHQYMNVCDEYDSKSRSQCGHSIMGDGFGENRALCYHYFTREDHRAEGNPLADWTNVAPAWSDALSPAPSMCTGFSFPKRAGYLPPAWSPTSTPDNYDYANFSFVDQNYVTAVGRVVDVP